MNGQNDFGPCHEREIEDPLKSNKESLGSKAEYEAYDNHLQPCESGSSV
ncbi:3540_t:CDS:1, partial [Cetraspora pellucida]